MLKWIILYEIKQILKKWKLELLIKKLQRFNI
jgi:hypothetical protein